MAAVFVGVVAGATVQEAAVVPDYQVARLPGMAVPMFRPGGAVLEVIQQGAGVFVIPAPDGLGVGAQVVIARTVAGI